MSYGLATFPSQIDYPSAPVVIPPKSSIPALQVIFSRLVDHGGILEQAFMAIEGANFRIFGDGPPKSGDDSTLPAATISGIIQVIGDNEIRAKKLWAEIEKLQQLA